MVPAFLHTGCPYLSGTILDMLIALLQVGFVHLRASKPDQTQTGVCSQESKGNASLKIYAYKNLKSLSQILGKGFNNLNRWSYAIYQKHNLDPTGFLWTSEFWVITTVSWLKCFKTKAMDLCLRLSVCLCMYITDVWFSPFLQVVLP